jgi:predicted dehydrogenase/nucleoside-diphosphate-sugar epimerase
MRILVTGATGFIGRRLIERPFAAGHAVVALTRRPAPDLAARGARVVEGAITDPALIARAVRGCDAVVHLAVAAGIADPRVVRSINLDATRLLLEASRAAGVRRFVFTSTISATRERVGPYGATKRAAEALVRDSGVPFVTLRPSLVYGAGGLGLFATLTQYLRRLPVVPVIGDGEIELDPIHVDDVCEVIEQCLVRDDVVGKTYDLLGPERVTFNQFLANVAGRIGVRKPVVHVPGGIALLMARMMGLVLKRPPISVDNVLGMISPARVDRGATARDFSIPWTRLSAGIESSMRGTAAGPAAAAPAPAFAPARSGLPELSLLRPGVGPSRPVRAAIVGLGKMGVVHSAVLAMVPGVEVVGLCDHHPAPARSLRGMGFSAPVFTRLDAMLAAVRPDAVWVCTPPGSHAAVAEACVAAGAAVFIEKPLAQSLDDARRIEALAATHAQPVACGYVFAFLPTFVASQHALEAGALGTVRRVSASMYLSQVFAPQRGWMYDPRLSGGGVVANISSHLLFLLLNGFGRPVAARATWAKKYGEVEDELRGVFTLAGGADMAFETSWSVPDYPLSATIMEAEGDNGTLRVTNETLALTLRAPIGGWPAGATSLRQSELPQPARFDLNGEGYYLEDAHFLAWVTGGAAPPITARAGCDVQRMMSALYASAERGGERVEVPA